MTDPKTGISEATVVIPIGMDCQKSNFPSSMFKTKDGWVNIWIKWIRESK